jgi:hypothetical protein
VAAAASQTLVHAHPAEFQCLLLLPAPEGYASLKMVAVAERRVMGALARKRVIVVPNMDIVDPLRPTAAVDVSLRLGAVISSPRL